MMNVNDALKLVTDWLTSRGPILFDLIKIPFLSISDSLAADPVLEAAVPPAESRAPGLLVSVISAPHLLIPAYQIISKLFSWNSWRGDVTGYVTQSPFNPICRFCKRNQLLTRKLWLIMVWSPQSYFHHLIKRETKLLNQKYC